MPKTSLKTLAALALLAAMAPQADANPHLPLQADAPAKTVRLAYSPVPGKFRQDAGLILVRDVRQVGNGGNGGCWNHCYNSYDECMGLKEKAICVSQMKTCMETCDRLSGLSNPTQRTSSQPGQPGR
jgi:hypothetical protein